MIRRVSAVRLKEGHGSSYCIITLQNRLLHYRKCFTVTQVSFQEQCVLLNVVSEGIKIVVLKSLNFE